ncbi:MAG: NAD-dependent epimerase/dehydratase family protein [Acidobacteria bacterium]|nr:NAD-dependent epimerase/dehydratase family protein [Acidobacteriota bacterium]
MRVLLTGGTGYLGRAIARALARRGHHAVIFARSARAAVAGGLPGIAVDGDVRDAAALASAAAGCDALCHTAALVSVWRRRRQDFHDVNVGGLLNALDAAAHHRITRIVYTSSFLALPPAGAAEQAPAGNDYQRTKRDAERAAADALARGAPLVRLYPGGLYGPGESTEGNLVGRLVADHLGGRLPGIVGADRTWSFAFVDDVAEAHVSSLERGAAGAAYALGGENAPQMRLFEILHQLTGRDLPRRIPVAAARIVAIWEELRAAILNRTPLLTRGTVHVLSHDWPLDSSAAMRDLDYRITPLSRGLAAVVASLSGH